MNSDSTPLYWKQLHPLKIAVRTWRAFQDNQLHARCAQFAYYSMLGLIPLLIVTLSVIAILPLDGMMDSLYSVLERTMPTDAYELIRIQINSIESSSTTGIILINLFVFGFAGGRLFITISEGLNSAFGLPPRYKRIRAFGISSIMPLIYALSLLVGLALMVVAPLAIHWMIQLFEMARLESLLLHTTRWIVVTGFLLMFTATLYCFVPATKVPWHLFTPGNVFAVAGWLFTSHGFKIYVDNFSHYDKTYGALGAVIVLLLWLYFTGAFLFVGGQINGVVFGHIGPGHAQTGPESSQTQQSESSDQAVDQLPQ